jgi:hypothetical protein
MIWLREQTVPRWSWAKIQKAHFPDWGYMTLSNWYDKYLKANDENTNPGVAIVAMVGTALKRDCVADSEDDGDNIEDFVVALLEKKKVQEHG